jgi:hypothetical protein
MLCVGVLAFTGCAPELKRVAPDWENPGQRLVGEELTPLLQAAGRDPGTCEVFFLETPHLNAADFGNCTFGFTTGFADTQDAALIEGVVAHEVAHEVLSHPEKQELAAGTMQGIAKGLAQAPGWGPVAALGVLAVSMVILPSYARVHEADADAKALELLQAAGDPDPPGTMAHAFEVLLAREGAQGGGILDTHPHTTKRLATMRELQAREPPIDRTRLAATPNATTAPASSTPPLGQAVSRKVYVLEPSTPPDPRADWSQRYKRMVAPAEKVEDTDGTVTSVDTKASE